MASDTSKIVSVNDLASPVNLGSNVFSRKINETYYTVKALPRDLRAFYTFAKVKFRMNQIIKNNTTVAQLFGQCVHRNPNKACFLFEDKVFTYRQVDQLTNRIANLFHNMGFEKGDVVALFMESRPEYVAVWLGLSKLGVVTALINFNLRDQSLYHCIKVANAKALIVGSELISAVEDIKESLGSGIQVLHYGSRDVGSNAMRMDCMDVLLEVSSPGRPPKIQINNSDKLMYIYTSGTTGLPKAAIISHLRYIMVTNGTPIVLGINEDDVIYTSLPLYHTSGGMLGIGLAITGNITVAIRKKFSATEFWDDCIKYKCTVAQYIGEICRYLLSQPPRPQDKSHRVRLIYGNGLRPQIWKAFIERFNIGIVREFYGATEGNASAVNRDNKLGAVGYIPWYSPLNSIYPILLIRVDEITGLPLRDANGLCIRCLPGEPGEMVGKIIPNDPFREFTGYLDNSATQSKLVRNVLAKGDTAFLSGDILVMDEMGYLYFKDRTGDTFRWKGENVSTAEVEAVISNLVNFKDCCAYGVEIPGCEGRAGMAAIVDPDNEIDMCALGAGIAKALPTYARPMFIRIKTELKMTGTYKMQKMDLVKEGFDPTLNSDIIYFLDPTTREYVRMNDDMHRSIMMQSLKSKL